MDSFSFEFRLQQLGKCVNEITNQSQYLQNLFNICIQDYEYHKFQEYTLNMAAAQENNENNKISPNELPILTGTGTSTPTKKKKKKKTKMEKEFSAQKIHIGVAIETALSTGITGDHTSCKECEEKGNFFNLKRPTPETEEQNIIITTDIKTENPKTPEIKINTLNSIKAPNAIEPTKSTTNTPKTPKPLKFPQLPDDLSDSNWPTQGHQFKSNRPKYTPISMKRPENVFSTFTKEEKERIVYDKLDLGIMTCERKWGTPHSILVTYIKSSNIYSSESERATWMSTQKIYIQERMNICEGTGVVEHVEHALRWRGGVSLLEVCQLSFERGIAVAAARHKINLFELDYILKHVYPSQYSDMEESKWFCLPVKMSKLDAVKLSKIEGVHYASKKCGMGLTTLLRYRKYYDVLEENMPKENKDDLGIEFLKKYSTPGEDRYDESLANLLMRYQHPIRNINTLEL